MENVRPTVDRFEVSDRSVILYVSEVKQIVLLLSTVYCSMPIVFLTVIFFFPEMN